MHAHHMNTVLLLASTFSSTFAHIHPKRDDPPLKKAVIDPVFYWDTMIPSFRQLTSSPHTIELWENNSMPIDCRQMMAGSTINGKELTSEDMEVFSVTYEDCDSGPWHFCRHPSAFGTKEVMAEQLGRLPPILRTYIHYTLSWGGDGVKMGPSGLEEGRAFYTPGTGDIAMSGDSINDTWVWIHEAAHAYDDGFSNALEDDRFTDGKNWTDAFNADEAVITEYALSDQQENFADTMMAVFFDLNFEGGIEGITDSLPQWINMYNLIIEAMGNDLTLGGTCGAITRYPDSELIDKTDPEATAEPARPPTGIIEDAHPVVNNTTPSSLPALKTASGTTTPTSGSTSTTSPSTTPTGAAAGGANLGLLGVVVPALMFGTALL